MDGDNYFLLSYEQLTRRTQIEMSTCLWQLTDTHKPEYHVRAKIIYDVWLKLAHDGVLKGCMLKKIEQDALMLKGFIEPVSNSV